MSNLGAFVTSYGAPLELKESPIPSPGKDEIVIKMKVFPIDPADVFSIKGQYPGWQPAALPAIPGLEGMGVVYAVGEGANTFQKGERVAPLLLDLPRSYQQYVVVKKGWVVKVPSTMSDDVASQLIVNPSTAWGLLERLRLQKGQFLVQSAAGSEVGRMVIQAAKMRGIKTVNLVRRKEQVEELKKLGADVVLCTQNEGKEGKEDLAERIKKETNGGVHGALDCVLGDVTGMMISSMVSGKLLIYGSMGSLSFNAMGSDILFKGVAIEGFWVTPLLKNLFEEKNGKKEEMMQEIFSWFENSPSFGAHVGEKFKLPQINEAVEASQKSGKPGKVLVQAE